MVNKLEEENENPIDALILKSIDKHIHLYKNVSPNLITTVSLLIGLISSYYLYYDKYLTAGLLFFLAYYVDCMDGKVARKYNKETLFGDFYDHFSDVFKVVAVFYVLYGKDKMKFKKYVLLAIVLYVLMVYQFGCQQSLYSNEDSKEIFLNIIKFNKNKCVKLIQDTKFFGSGTFILVTTFIIIFWRNI